MIFIHKGFNIKIEVIPLEQDTIRFKISGGMVDVIHSFLVNRGHPFAFNGSELILEEPIFYMYVITTMTDSSYWIVEKVFPILRGKPTKGPVNIWE